MSIAPATASDLIGRIYDCAIEPSRWQQTLAAMCAALNCHVGSLTLLDRSSDPPTLFGNFQSGALDPYWAAQHTAGNYAAEAMAFFEQALMQPGIDPDTPLVISHIMDAAAYNELRVVKEWAGPQGFCDCMSIVVLDTPGRFATIDQIRQERHGRIGAAEFAAFRMLAPHLRRAVAISNLLDLQSLETTALSTGLAKGSIAILLVDPFGAVLHANPSAQAMLSHGRTLRTEQGVLTAASSVDTEALQHAIAETAGKLAPSGMPGGPVRLQAAEDGVLIHVLPLKLGQAQLAITARPVAAVLVSDTRGGVADSVAALSEIYHLTPSERRVLEHLAAGRSLVDVGFVLDVQVSTVRTHLARLFAKTGTRRQAKLVALVARLGLGG